MRSMPRALHPESSYNDFGDSSLRTLDPDSHWVPCPTVRRRHLTQLVPMPRRCPHPFRTRLRASFGRAGCSSFARPWLGARRREGRRRSIKTFLPADQAIFAHRSRTVTAGTPPTSFDRMEIGELPGSMMPNGTTEKAWKKVHAHDNAWIVEKPRKAPKMRNIRRGERQKPKSYSQQSSQRAYTRPDAGRRNKRRMPKSSLLKSVDR